MTTKSLKPLFHRVMMTAWAVIVSYSYATPAFAGPWGWVKEQAGRAVKAGKEAVDTVKDLLEVGRFERHWEQFSSETQAAWYRDLWGRSWAQTIVIACTWYGASLLFFRPRKEKGGSLYFYASQLAAFAIAFVAGWLFEMYRTLMLYQVTDAKLEPSHALAAVALVLIGLASYYDKLPLFFKARSLGQGTYFRKTWELVPEGPALPDTTAEPTDAQPEGDSGAASAPADEAVPQPAPNAEPVPVVVPVAPPVAPPVLPVAPPAPQPFRPELIACPSCGKRTKAKAKGCGHCGTSFQKSQEPTVVCKECGRMTQTNAKGCGHCGALLGQAPAPGKAKRKPRDLLDI